MRKGLQATKTKGSTWVCFLTTNLNPKKQPHYHKQQTENWCVYDPLWGNKCPCPRNGPQKAAHTLKQIRIGAWPLQDSSTLPKPPMMGTQASAWPSKRPFNSFNLTRTCRGMTIRDLSTLPKPPKWGYRQGMTLQPYPNLEGWGGESIVEIINKIYCCQGVKHSRNRSLLHKIIQLEPMRQ